MSRQLWGTQAFACTTDMGTMYVNFKITIYINQYFRVMLGLENLS